MMCEPGRYFRPRAGAKNQLTSVVCRIFDSRIHCSKMSICQKYITQKYIITNINKKYAITIKSPKTHQHKWKIDRRREMNNDINVYFVKSDSITAIL